MHPRNDSNLTFYKTSTIAKNFVLPYIFQKEKVDFSYNKLANPNFLFYDNTLVEAVKSGDKWVHLFFLSLSLCHTVMSEEKVEGKKRPRTSGTEKVAQSPGCWRGTWFDRGRSLTESSLLFKGRNVQSLH